MSTDKFELKKLFLEAVLAEYKRLTDETINHQKNMSYVFAVMAGGVATILGVFGIGIVSFLLIPVFVSACGSLIGIEGCTSALISYYIVDEIEHKKLSKLFANDSPIRYEEIYELHYGLLSGIYWGMLFFISLSLCLACLIAVAWVWSQAPQNIFNEIVYFFGWTISAFYALSTTVIILKLHNESNRIKNL